MTSNLGIFYQKEKILIANYFKFTPKDHTLILLIFVFLLNFASNNPRCLGYTTDRTVLFMQVDDKKEQISKSL